MSLRNDIKKAIKDGKIEKPIRDLAKEAEEKRKQDETKKKLKEQEIKDREYAQEVLARLPSEIKEAIAESKSVIKVVIADYKSDLQQGWRLYVYEGLEKLGLNPKFGYDKWEDWNAYDTGYPKYESIYYIWIDIEALTKENNK